MFLLYSQQVLCKEDGVGNEIDDNDNSKSDNDRERE